MRERNWFHCDDEKLINEYYIKQEFVDKICERVTRCPKCKKGHFFKETSDDVYSSESWYMCDTCWDSYPSKQREKILQDIYEPACGADYWDYALYFFIDNFERCYNDNDEYLPGFYEYEKVRDFDPNEWNKEHCNDKNFTPWQEMVKNDLKAHIEDLNKIIERSKQYKLLKEFFEDNNGNKRNNSKS